MGKKKAKIEHAMPVPSSNHDYETEGHMRTLMDAEQIKMDAEKMKKVHKLAGKHKKAIRSIQDIKDFHQKKYGPEGMEDDAHDSIRKEKAEGE